MKGMKTLMNETGKIARGNLVALAAALGLALAFGPVLAATIVVPTTSNPDIQDGINAAGSGDTVLLKAKCNSAISAHCGFNGLYHQGVDIDRKITLNCSGAILDGDVPLGKKGERTDAGVTTEFDGPTQLSGDGIDILSDGDGTTIVNCTIKNFGGDGIEVNDADGVTIRNNRLINNDSGDGGLDINSADDYLVERNTAIENDGDGFDIDNTVKTLFENNLAKDNGREGFRIGNDSDSNTFKNNRAIGNAEDGFEIDDSSSGTNTLIKNTIKRNFGDGIDIDSNTDDTVIDGNRVIGNRGTGIENDGKDDTIIKDNTMRGNRTDLAGKGDDCDAFPDEATDGGGNTFDTGGFDVCTPGTGDE